MAAKRLGEWLVEVGWLAPAQLEHALQVQSGINPPPKLGALLISLNYLEEGQVARALATQMGVPIWDLEESPPDPAVKNLVPAAMAQQCHLIPVAASNGCLQCAAAGPIAAPERRKLEFLAGRPVKLAVAPESDILRQLQSMYDFSVESMIADLTRAADNEREDQEQQTHDLRDMAEEPTLINLVNVVISNAIRERASDIHLEPFENELKLKYRIDGILQEIQPPPKQFQSALVSRIKIMAGLDIAERYIPQDGQIRVSVLDTRVDIRVSTVPTVYGESVVLRLLNKDEALLQLTHLGLSDDERRRLGELLHRPYGIILVCGPTGSGKSTTLYGALKSIYTPEKKIITIEDPVEYQLHGINQIPVRPKRGLTFASGLRSILRQDPDVIMVGEIRDRETADIAIRAALTGHLVFSTLHTNDSSGAITRLLDMGVEPFLIASSIQGVLAQRLVRRLCTTCRRPTPPDPLLVAQFGVERIPQRVFAPEGCDECRGRGYSGRIGIFELLTVDDRMHDLILRRASANEVKAAALSRMTTMRQDGWYKVCAGVTSMTEVLQATQMAGEDFSA